MKQKNSKSLLEKHLEELSVEDLNFKKMNGLIPVIAQEVDSETVLMLGYVNLDAIKKTQDTGFAHYWSRSRKIIWKKGERSGHLQKIVEVLVDCDRDTLIYKVTQKGPACHTGKPNCFFNRLIIKK